jgi:adenylosuccinate lyase
MRDPFDDVRNPLATRYATPAMVANFADRRRIVLWRKLWIALASAQRDLGLEVTTEQIEAMRAHVDEIDFARVAELEAKLRHDVMAHVQHFGELVGPQAEKIIHLGATSCFVADNAELVMMRDGVDLLMDRLVAVIGHLRDFALEHRELPTLAYTHFQPAQLTTVGKRACLWAQDFAFDLESLAALRERIPFRGAKGTTGTQASFLSLFDGDHDKVRALDRQVAREMGFAATIPVSGQTYTRKIDTWVVQTLADVCASASKLAVDIRLLSNKREVEEPFGRDQVGSSAMAYKRNPMRCERVCGLARFVHGLASNPLQTHANQWFERTLDDSANRRLAITDAFLGTDAVLNLIVDVTAGLVVNPAVIAMNLRDDLPFMATENVIMAGVRAGGSRRELHERIREHSHAAARRMKEQGVSNDLVDRMKADDQLGPFVTASELDPARYVGRAPQQVEEFVHEVLDPMLELHAERRGRFVSKLSV